jgi:hypothetical protein
MTSLPPRQGHVVGGLDLLAQSQFQRHAAAVVGVGRLDRHRQADVLGGFPGVFGAVTMRPSGTGTPQEASRVLVRSLSREMLSAMAEVESVSAVQMRRWRAPWPSCTRLPSFRRMKGMPRSDGAVDDAAGAGAEAQLVGQLAQLSMATGTS